MGWEMTEPLAAMVLAGGSSRRLGENKALLRLGGVALIERVYQALAPLTQEVLLVVASPEQADALPRPLSAQVVLDRYPGRGPLGGLLSGLEASPRPWCLAVACDMPFLDPELLGYLASLRPGFDAVVPRWAGRPQPLHALYSRACLEPIEDSLEGGKLRADSFLGPLCVRYVSEGEIRPRDPAGRSFLNVNTGADLARAQALLAGG